MIDVVCRTNLDLTPCEKWPNALPALPSVGDEIESEYRWKREHYDVHLSLKVYAVRWRFADSDFLTGYVRKGQWYPEIELNVPSPYKTIREFYEWYGRITGRGVSAFI